VSVRDATTKVVRAGKTSREPSYARAVRVLDGAGEHSRLQTGSCYCEPVWWIPSGRFRTRNTPPEGSGFAPGTRKRKVHHGLSAASKPLQEVRWRDRNKIRARAVLKTGSPAWEAKRNLRDKRQDP
jgi:hypothetical protein